MNLYEELQWRGLIQDESPELAEKLAAGPVTVYCGYDPTARSMHFGNLQQLVVLRHFQRHGHTAIALRGGGTGLIGDPSGKSAERPLVDEATTAEWTQRFQGQMERILEPGAVFLDNLEWLGRLRMVDFLRDVGKHFPMGYMLAKESVKTRVHGEGMSYAEFSYMLLQAYDFLRLYDDHGCRVQFGGSDQWGNITAGLELLRRTGRHGAAGMTVPLILRPDGTKFGKTEEGAIWLDPELTSPYAFYQFFINQPDEQAAVLLRRLTLIPPQEIEAIEARHAEAPHERIAQRAVAEHLTELVHEPEGLAEARAVTEWMFGDGGEAVSRDALAGIEVPELDRSSLPGWPAAFVAAGLASSNGEARRLIEGGGLYAGDRKIAPDDEGGFPEGLVVLRKGRKTRVPVLFV